MKLAGAFFIFFSALFGSLRYITTERRHAKSLSALAESLHFICSQIGGSHMPLPELFLKLSEKFSGEVGLFFKELSESMDRLGELELRQLWENACATALPCLTEDERECVIGVGGIIGRYSAGEQARLIGQAARQLELYRDRRREQLNISKRVYMGVSLSVAALLVITLI